MLDPLKRFSWRRIQHNPHENYLEISEYMTVDFLPSFSINRFAASFISWGIAFSAPFIGGDIYINVLISAVAAVPAYPISAVLTLR